MSSTRASKRNSAREIITPGCSTSSTTQNLGFACLPLSPAQLREVWAFDNECANQMGAPLRSCSCVEVENSDGVSHTELLCLKDTIRDMWDRAKGVFEIFCDVQRPDLGFRLRIKPSLPIKVTLKSDDAFYMGWCATAPANDPSLTAISPCAHLYQRSPVYPQGYMGGPASYCNWMSGKDATARFTRPTNCSSRFMVRLECKNLTGGTEITWNYGSDKEMPIPGSAWFKKDECCNILNGTEKRQEKKGNLVPFINVEKCVLCGEAFPNNNKETRVQRKPHFINSHANYFGSTWDGLDKPYMQEEVSGTKVLTESDKLNHLIQSLQKDLNWQVIPACTVMSAVEIKQYGEDTTGLLEEFKNRCRLLRASGVMVLRGMTAIDREKNLSVHHLKPIRTSAWRTLSWSEEDGPPPKGHYGVPKDLKTEQVGETQSALFNFCVTNL